MINHPLDRKITRSFEEFLQLGRWFTTGDHIACWLVQQDQTETERAY